MSNKIFLTKIFVFLIGGLILMTNSCSQPKATLIIKNAKVWTGNSTQPYASAVAIHNNRIIAVGDESKISRYIISSTQIIDAKGNLVLPGFIDAHLHFIEGGKRLSQVKLRDAKTKSEFIKRVKDFASTCPPGIWITGGDWDHSLWGGELPEKGWIDSVTPNNPVWLNRLDGHMALANSVALNMAGINRETPDIPGGTIVRDQNGEPTGILKDNAMDLLSRIIPEPDDTTKLFYLQNAMHYVASQGITSVHHMGDWDDLEIFSKAIQEGKAIIRIYAAVPLATYQEIAKKKKFYKKFYPWLKVEAVKGFLDGSLGSHTAAFLEPYTDTPNDSGLLVISPEKLYQLVKGADKSGLQVCIHAIGDRANRIILDIYEKVTKENGIKDRRFRVEHAQHLHPEDIERFSKLNIIASMQPYHAIDDGRWAEKYIGLKRCKTTYAFRSLLDSRAILAFGSDWYVAPPSPLWGIYAAVTRQTLDGKNPEGWIPEQKISVEEAVKAYTINAAYASFEEKVKGSIEPGKFADLVILNRDIFSINPEEIPQVKILMTICDGKIIYKDWQVEEIK